MSRLDNTNPTCVYTSKIKTLRLDNIPTCSDCRTEILDQHGHIICYCSYWNKVVKAEEVYYVWDAKHKKGLYAGDEPECSLADLDMLDQHGGKRPWLN